MPFTILRSLLLIAAIHAFAGAALGAEAVRLMAFGDSLVHGYGLPGKDTFPAQLERALIEKGHSIEVLNAGNSGDTTAAGLARLEWSLADQPDAVIVVLGGNDGLRGLEPQQTYSNLSAIIARLETNGLPVLLAGMLAPRNLGPAYVEEFDRVFSRLAEEWDLVFYPFFLDGVAAETALNQADGIHPNAAGVAEIVVRIMPSVEELLNRVATSS